MGLGFSTLENASGLPASSQTISAIPTRVAASGAELPPSLGNARFIIQKNKRLRAPTHYRDST